MITRWMRQMKKIRPWMVAVALACGAPLWAPACGGGGDDSEQDGAPDATDVTEDATTADEGGSPDEATPGEDATMPDGDAAAPEDAGADCVPAMFYGPPEICTDNAQCEADFGAGWTCTGYETLPSTCDGDINWGPFCENAAGADADADGDVGDTATWYGPEPVDADATDTPAGWYGPVPTDASDTPGNLYGPPPPDDADDAPATLYGPSIPDV